MKYTRCNKLKCRYLADGVTANGEPVHGCICQRKCCYHQPGMIDDLNRADRDATVAVYFKLVDHNVYVVTKNRRALTRRFLNCITSQNWDDDKFEQDLNGVIRAAEMRYHGHMYAIDKNVTLASTVLSDGSKFVLSKVVYYDHTITYDITHYDATDKEIAIYFYGQLDQAKQHYVNSINANI